MGKSDKKDKKSEKIIDKKEKKVKKEKKEKLDKASKKSKKERKDKDKSSKKDKKERKDKDKSSKKDKKRKHSESDSEEEFVVHKKNKVAEPVVVESKPQAPVEATAGWNDWNKASFDGDDAKKNKFLRLLGAKKSSPATATQAFVPASGKKSGGGLYGGLKSAIDEDEKKRISNDLEKQFDHGLQFRKQMQMGRRGGLGFN